jgi:hypothetical protein
MAEGATITTYAWDVEDGTITVGTSSSPSITATFPLGFRYVHLTVTDSNGKTHTTHVPVLVYDDSLTLNRFEVQRSLRPQGQMMTITLFEDVPIEEYRDGFMILYWEREFYGGVEGSLTGDSVKFYGWHNSDTFSTRAQNRDIQRQQQIQAIDVAGRLSHLVGFPQVVERDSTPSTWQEMAHTNINRYVHYILHWHSTALSLVDFLIDRSRGDLYPFPALESSGMALFEQANGRAEAIAHKLTCRSNGALQLVPNPQEDDVPFRTHTVIVPLEAGDVKEAQWQNAHAPRVHWLQAGAILTNTADASAGQVVPIFALAPGDAPGQGATSQNKNYQLVRERRELRIRTGHQYALLNRKRTNLRVVLARGGDAGIEPADMEWLTVSLSKHQADRRGDALGGRFLPLQVDITHNNQQGTNDVAVVLEEEVIGNEAVDYFPPDYTFPTFSDYSYIPPVVYWTDSIFDEDVLQGVADAMGIDNLNVLGICVLLNDLGKIARTFDLLKSGVSWESITPSIANTTSDMAGRYLVDTDVLPTRIITHDGNIGGAIYVTSDAKGTPFAGWSLEHSFTYTGTSPVVARSRIVTSKNEDYWMVAYATEDGVRVLRKTGATWGTIENPSGYSYSDANLDTTRYLGATIDGANFIVPDLIANNRYGLWMHSGASWTRIGSKTFERLPNVIEADGQGNLYVGVYDDTHALVPDGDDFLGAKSQTTYVDGNPTLVNDTFAFTPSYNTGAYTASTTQGLISAGQSMTIRWDMQDNYPLSELNQMWWIVELAQITSGATPVETGVTLRYELTARDTLGNPYVASGDIYFEGTGIITNVVGSDYRHYVYAQVFISDLVDINEVRLSSIEVKLTSMDELSNLLPYDYEIHARIPFVNWVSVTPTYGELVRIDDYASSPVVTDVIPSPQYAPSHMRGIHADPLNGDRLAMVGSLDAIEDLELFRTVNQGTLWNAQNYKKHRWAKRAGTIALVTGEGLIDFTTSGFGNGSLVSRIGDLYSVIGDVSQPESALLVFTEADT